MAKLRYLGGGFLHRVPSRDLSEDEAKRFGVKRLLASGLYEEIKQPKKKKAVHVMTYDEELSAMAKELDEIEDTFEEG